MTVWIHKEMWPYGRWCVRCGDCKPTLIGTYKDLVAANANADAHRDKDVHLPVGGPEW